MLLITLDFSALKISPGYREQLLWATLDPVNGIVAFILSSRCGKMVFGTAPPIIPEKFKTVAHIYRECVHANKFIFVLARYTHGFKEEAGRLACHVSFTFVVTLVKWLSILDFTTSF